MLKVLISTIQPVSGGVPTMLRFILECLSQRSCEVTIAYYEPYSVSSECSVPLYKLPLLKSPSNKVGPDFMGHKCVGLGSWLPELEFTNYWATQRWNDLIEKNDVHLCVSGSSLAALPFVQTKTPFLAWIATDWEGDRTHRVEQFGWFRRLVDKTLVKAFAKGLEKKIIETESIIALSEHTRSELNKIAGYEAVSDVMQMPIDTELFKPLVQKAEKDSIKIGFVGRFEDPRKHISLLLNSVGACVAKGVSVKLVLVGDSLSSESLALIKKLGISDRIEVMSYVAREKLPNIFSDWDVFVIPSHQEGLCIAALEAMACAVPVISTKCGGPESYIEHGKNGWLVDHSEEELSLTIANVFHESDERRLCGQNARETVNLSFSKEAKQDQFLASFDRMASAVKLS